MERSYIFPLPIRSALVGFAPLRSQLLSVQVVVLVHVQQLEQLFHVAAEVLVLPTLAAQRLPLAAVCEEAAEAVLGDLRALATVVVSVNLHGALVAARVVQHVEHHLCVVRGVRCAVCGVWCVVCGV